MRKKILEILLSSLKAKIVTSIVAISLVGGAVTVGVIYKNSIDQSTKKEVSLESNLEDISKETKENIDEKEDETLDNSGKATEEKASTNESEDQKVTISNDGGNNGGLAEPSKDSSSSQGGNINPSNNTNSNSAGSSNNEGSSNNGGNPIPSQPTQSTPAPIQVGIDNGMTSQLRSLISTAQGYTGTKVGDFRSKTSNLANGSISEDSIKSLLYTSWQEDLTGKYPGASGVYNIEITKVDAYKITMSSSMTAADVTLSNKQPKGTFSDMVAYRNSDGSYSIACIGISFGIGK
jgi:hypothetical protein